MKQYGVVFCLCMIVICCMSCDLPIPSKNNNAIIYHVSPDGDDANPGTEVKPFRTIERAQQILRQHKPENTGETTVYLHKGVYAFDKSITFSAEDSGTKDSPIVFTAYQNQSVKFIGGKELPKKWFSSVNDPAIVERIISDEAKRKVISVNLHEHGIKEYGQLSMRGFPDHDPEMPHRQKKQPAPMELFYGGQRQTIARWPNTGHLTLAEVLDAGPTWDWDKDDTPEFWLSGGTFRFNSKDANSWRPGKGQKADDVWVSGFFSKAWAWNYNKVEKIAPSAKTITLRYGVLEGGVLSNDTTKYGKRYFYFENLLEEIDQPGEYYLDRNDGTLYVWPPDAWDNSQEGFVVSLLVGPILDFQKAEHIAFKNIIFEGGRGFAVRCQGSRGIVIDNCEIRNFTTGGMYIDAYETQITNSHIHHTGGTAIHLLGGDFETLTPSGNVLDNCEIDNFGYWDKVYYPGITIRGVGQRISNCLIHDGPHMGVMIYGNDHMIEYNEFYSVPNELRDMSAIYVNLGERIAERGTVIGRNYFHDIGLADDIGKQGAVYFDSSTNAFTVEENMFYNIGTVASDWTVMVHGGSYMNIRNNVFVDCAKPYHSAFWLTTWGKSWIPWYEKRWEAMFEKYDFASMPHGKKYPELLRFLEEDRLIPDNNVFERNVIYNPSKAVAGKVVTIKDTDEKVLIQKDNWTTKDDPGFVNAKEKDFRFKKDAKVFKEIPGFSDIHFEEMGLKK